MARAPYEKWSAGSTTIPRVPKYYRLKQELQQDMSRLAPGTAIPTERELSARFGVSRTTVRQALQELVVDGLLQRCQGRGNFVAPPKVTQTLQLTSYTEDTVATGRLPTSRVLEAALVRATVHIAKQLNLPPNARVQRLERLRLADGEPMAVEAVYLDAARFPGIGAAIEQGSSLYQLLRDRYSVSLVRAEETLETVLASPQEASLLDTGTGLPLLLLTRTSWDEEDRPIEYVRSLYRGDRYRFVAHLMRPATVPPQCETQQASAPATT